MYIHVIMLAGNGRESIISVLIRDFKTHFGSYCLVENTMVSYRCHITINQVFKKAWESDTTLSGHITPQVIYYTSFRNHSCLKFTKTCCSWYCYSHILRKLWTMCRSVHVSLHSNAYFNYRNIRAFLFLFWQNLIFWLYSFTWYWLFKLDKCLRSD